MPSVLIIEDDPAMSDAIGNCLESAGFETERCPDGTLGLRRALEGSFDVITLDRMLPGLEGLELVKRLRAAANHTPVLMLSSLGNLNDRVEGLRGGGDDYLIKPFEPSELIVRLEVLVRRQNQAARSDLVLRVGDLELDLMAREARRRGQVIELLPTEFKLLEFMMRNAGRLLTRRVIFEKVWGYQFDPGTNLIDVHIGKIRKKVDLPNEQSMFTTERGLGYELHAV